MLASDTGIALLDVGEEALFGGEEGAGPVGVDGAAFEDEAARLSGRRQGGELARRLGGGD